jgi:catechol 2,3-dioxygenase-like lactoylglutathione lyase family enzyme
MPDITGYHHVSLTVPDIDKSTSWYCEVLGFSKVKDFERDGYRKVLLMHPSSATGFGFTDHGARASGDSFTEYRTGMDHLAFTVADRATLEAWRDHFEANGVEHSEIKPSAMGDVIIFRDPDNVQLEVYAPYPTS